MSHVIKMIAIISPNRFSNNFLYINKAIIKHICDFLRIHMDNIIMHYLLYNIFHLTIFCINDVIDDTPSSLYIAFCCIEFMFIIILLWSSNLYSDKNSEISIKIFRILFWQYIAKDIFLNVWYYFVGNPGLSYVLVWKCFRFDRTTQLVCIVNSMS